MHSAAPHLDLPVLPLPRARPPPSLPPLLHAVQDSASIPAIRHASAAFDAHGIPHLAGAGVHRVALSPLCRRARPHRPLRHAAAADALLHRHTRPAALHLRRDHRPRRALRGERPLLVRRGHWDVHQRRHGRPRAQLGHQRLRHLPLLLPARRLRQRRGHERRQRGPLSHRRGQHRQQRPPLRPQERRLRAHPHRPRGRGHHHRLDAVQRVPPRHGLSGQGQWSKARQRCCIDYQTRAE